MPRRDRETEKHDPFKAVARQLAERLQDLVRQAAPADGLSNAQLNAWIRREFSNLETRLVAPIFQNNYHLPYNHLAPMENFLHAYRTLLASHPELLEPFDAIAGQLKTLHARYQESPLRRITASPSGPSSGRS